MSTESNYNAESGLPHRPITFPMSRTPKPSHDRSAAANFRQLHVVLVIDRKVQKYLRVREMACADIEAVARSLNVSLKVNAETLF